MKYIMTTSLVLLSVSMSYAVNNLRIPNIRSLGMGGNEVTQSSLFNPAIVSLSTNSHVDFEYFNRYGLKELSSLSGTFSYYNNYVPLAFNVFSFGYDDYRESMFRFSLSKQLSDKWFLGVSFQYSLIQIKYYEEQLGRFSTDVGFLFNPVDDVLIGVLISDLPSVKINDENINTNSFNNYLIQIGFQYKVINTVLIAASLGHNNRKNIYPDLGIEFEPYENVFVRAGMEGDLVMPTVGVGYKYSDFNINTAFTYHSVLGISSGIGISYSF